MNRSTTTLLPVRIPPLPEELFSSWIVRLAHELGQKVQSFCHLIFGNNHQVWNRDIDRLAPTWLMDGLSCRTGISRSTIENTTLRAYEGVFYPSFKSAGNLCWMLALKMYHRKRNGFGLQFCPQCLSEDIVPYYRKYWRVALNTVCHRHQISLLDRCPCCNHAVVVHRLDMNGQPLSDSIAHSSCFFCGFELSRSQPLLIDEYSVEGAATLQRITQKLELGLSQWTTYDVGQLAVLRHLTMLLTSPNPHNFLREYVTDQLHVKDILLTPGGISIEARPWLERRHLIQLSSWLLADPVQHITKAWKSGAIRYNVLIKDFTSPPDWYLNIVSPLSNWRDR